MTYFLSQPEVEQSEGLLSLPGCVCVCVCVCVVHTQIHIYLFIYIDTNNSGLKVPGHY